MKKIIILLILLSLFSYVWYTFALWNWIKWIYNTSNPTLWQSDSRFTDVWQIWWIDAYKDNFTWLYWEKSPAWWSKTWQDAMDYCTTIWDNNWRLATKNELSSIIVDTKIERYWSTFYTALPSVNSYNYWSSTLDPNSAFGNAWAAGVSIGNLHSSFSGTNNATLCIHN